MALIIKNTLSQSLETFEPINPPNVGLYTCGPTVYNYIHIGNCRAYVFTDVLKRYLSYRGYIVKHIMNITDIDDKTIKASIEQGITLRELTKVYTDEFYEDLNSLNILPASNYTLATDYIKEMLEIIETLIDKDYAYKMEDGSIYFDISKDEEYGKLSHFKLENLKENAKGRLSSDEYDKENANDFALWKAWDEKDGEVFWDPSDVLGKESVIGKGRPGWHIECSAMSMKNLGESFDIHTGGVDNIFPHHENEIAQSECATGKKFAKYFMHNEHLLVDNKKMSKSLGNFYTLSDLISKGINPIAFRMWLYNSNYTTKANFTLESVAGTQIALDKLKDFYLNLGDVIGVLNKEYKERFIEALDNNLDTSKAMALVWELTKDTEILDEDKKATILDFDQVLGLGLRKLYKKDIPEEIIILAKKREEYRENKNWAKSDEIRDIINEKGYEIKDGDQSYKITKL